MESRDLRENQQPSEIFVSLIKAALEYGDEANPRIDEVVYDIKFVKLNK